MATERCPAHIATAAAGGDAAAVASWLDDVRSRSANSRAELGSNTLLIAAARRGKIPVVELLLGRGASCDLQNNKGATALMAAAQHGHLGTVQLLLGAGARVDMLCDAGFTAAQLAEGRRQTAVAALLKQHSAEETGRHYRDLLRQERDALRLPRAGPPRTPGAAASATASHLRGASPAGSSATRTPPVRWAATE